MPTLFILKLPVTAGAECSEIHKHWIVDGMCLDSEKRGGDWEMIQHGEEETELCVW